MNAGTLAAPSRPHSQKGAVPTFAPAHPQDLTKAAGTVPSPQKSTVIRKCVFLRASTVALHWECTPSVWARGSNCSPRDKRPIFSRPVVVESAVSRFALVKKGRLHGRDAAKTPGIRDNAVHEQQLSSPIGANCERSAFHSPARAGARPGGIRSINRGADNQSTASYSDRLQDREPRLRLDPHRSTCR
jgi:hypothetical protein